MIEYSLKCDTATCDATNCVCEILLSYALKQVFGEHLHTEKNLLHMFIFSLFLIIMIIAHAFQEFHSLLHSIEVKLNHAFHFHQHKINCVAK